ncbi:MAG TPA: TolC family protein [Steroidobacteraceae bacterium]
MIGRVVVIGCIGFAPMLVAHADNTAELDVVVERYVAEGLRSNLALQGETLEVDKATEALAAARARFFPEVSLQARYSRAEGGREFTIPIGTTLNPVYSTLNELLAAQGQPARFAQVADISVPFLRREEQDTRVSVRQPIYAPSIPAAVRAQRALLDAASFNRMAVARALRRDVTIAYLDWLKARSAVEIVSASEALLRENLRVSASLFDNGKVTEDQVLRAKAELLAVDQQQRETENFATQAQSFFNFLLNRELQAPIETSAPPVEAARQDGALPRLWSDALERRPEIGRVDQLRRAAEEQLTVARKQQWPELSLGLDAGTQGEQYRFGDHYNFGIASLVFTWRLFDGGGDSARARQARATERQLVLRKQEIAQQIRLEVQQAFDRLTTARDSLTTAAARADAARAAFRIASRKRDEGVINQVEFIDARSALTSAELNHNVTRFDVLARRAELEYATSSGDLPLDPGA